MKKKILGPTNPKLPPLGDIPRVLECKREDITVYDLNPFSFYINYDPDKMCSLDSKVQEFGRKITDDQNAEEPPDFAMVRRGDHWHRAHVLEKFYNAHQECHGAEVSLIDSGHRVSVDVKHIFPIPPEVLTAGPAQSLRILPKEIECSPRQIVELFEYCPEVKFRLTFDDEFSISSKRKPHTAGAPAEVEVGFEDWISMRQLFRLNFLEDGQDSNGTARTIGGGDTRTNDEAQSSNHDVDDHGGRTPGARNHFDSNGRIKFEPLVSDTTDARTPESPSLDTPNNSSTRERSRQRRADPSELNGGASVTNGEPSRRNSSDVAAEIQRNNLRGISNVAGSDEDFSDVADDYSGRESDENIKYTARSGAVPVDVEGENQGEIITARSIANAKQVARRNQHREKICVNFRKMGGCSDGKMCPHKHDIPIEETLTATGTTVEFRDYPDINLRQDFHGFGLCTHVDENGSIYLVLPYGAASIWDVLECKPNLERDFLNIKHELSKRHGTGPKRGGKRRSNISSSEPLAVVWIDKPESGMLGNVQQGWYRAKILWREEKKCKVFLVDHGAVLLVDMENLYPIEDDLLLPQQVIRCKLQDTTFKKQPGNDLEMYAGLKEKILVFKVYEYHPEDSYYVVELIEVNKECVSTHYGEHFERKGIVEWVI